MPVLGGAKKGSRQACVLYGLLGGLHLGEDDLVKVAGVGGFLDHRFDLRQDDGVEALDAVEFRVSKLRIFKNLCMT